MKPSGWSRLKQFARSSRSVLRRVGPIPGQFQTYSHTLPDRYPWLFRFAASQLATPGNLRLLSFGCSSGEEVFALRRYFPKAEIVGIDVDPQNIALCKQRAHREGSGGLRFVTAASTADESRASYDAIFCLAVLCLGDLTVSGALRSDPHLYFEDFDAVLTDFARCLKPSGLLLLHTTNFRFCDTSIAPDFETLLEAEPDQMAPDVQFDRQNRLLPGARYRAVAFRKRTAAPSVPE
jgi:SAM-dependent methyltransferase